MDLGISIFLIFIRCVALRNLDLLIKTDWSIILSALLLRTLAVVGRRHRSTDDRDKELKTIWEFMVFRDYRMGNHIVSRMI